MRFILPLIPVLLFSCNKEKKAVPVTKPATELLTQQSWILNAADFDDNANGVLDAEENSIADCQKDNSYVFHTNGTGEANDNAITCGNPVNTQFNWRLLNNATELEIAMERIFILQLDNDTLVLQPHLPGLTAKFMMVYSH
jgi:hypothetical protein